MTRDEFVKFISAIKAYYQGDDLFKTKEAMELWYAELKDLDYQIAVGALRRHVQSSPYIPKISDVRQSVADIVTNDEGWSKGYADMMMAVRRFGYMQERLALDSMDPLTRETTRRIGWRQICESENPEVIRGQFRMIYDQVASTGRESVTLSDDVQQIGNEEIRKRLAGIF